MEFTKQEGTSFIVEAKPFRPKPGAPEEKEYLPVDLAESPPVWATSPVTVEGVEYIATLEPLGDGMKCKITLPNFPDTATEATVITVQQTVDAKRGAGVVGLERSFVINVAPEEPTDVEFVEVDG